MCLPYAYPFQTTALTCLAKGAHGALSSGLLNAFKSGTYQKQLKASFDSPTPPPSLPLPAPPPGVSRAYTREPNDLNSPASYILLPYPVYYFTALEGNRLYLELTLFGRR